MATERDFWRLLADYERLTIDESAALGGGDFDGLAVLQDLKDPLLETMRTLANDAGLDRTHPELASRVDRALSHAHQNRKLIDNMLSRARTERQNLDAAKLRLRGLGTAYGLDGAERPAFSAHV